MHKKFGGNLNIEWNNSLTINEIEAQELINSLALSIPINDQMYEDLLERIELLEPLSEQIERLETKEPESPYGFNFCVYFSNTAGDWAWVLMCN